jgi:hypothetical protein
MQQTPGRLSVSVPSRASLIADLLPLAVLALFGLVGACSSGGSTTPASTSYDAGSPREEAGPDCGSLVVHNEAGCPPTYDTAALPSTCAPVGLTCVYPGLGDVTPPGSGCSGPAGLSCVAGMADAGAHWISAQ